MNAEMTDELKARAMEAFSRDMQRNTSPIRKELDMLILEAQARSIKRSVPYEK